ncbi:MAG TPA: bifunctional 5,10-methylenetetrahydrofolate dehydrogenase/5,10-methenyltetrahydrofolate cyclohydrolase [Candidatus Binataceae bacterium]|nr:bifunctional 5,10-methylenetetrahydrofolate dehydrogenase/5,10-methenyltetrahydrofolate cyclohydrolase [Candidatus Binataceae bacterium]
MAATIMDGRALSRRLQAEVRDHARELSEHHRLTLAAIMVGSDPASRQYVANKRRLAERLGLKSEIIEIEVAAATTESMLATLAQLNADPRITGILIQLPLPESVDGFRLFDAIAPEKDVDALGVTSVGGFYRGEWGRFIPCTPRGVLTLLSAYRVPLAGARAVVIGRSDIAGKPLAFILGGRMCNATVTWCHRHTRDLAAVCREADLLVSCTGARVVDRDFLITAEMVKPGACVIDVGFRRVGPGRFVGDVDFDNVSRVAGWITPSPGGTGPMTVMALMQNLVDAARYQMGLPRAQYSI